MKQSGYNSNKNLIIFFSIISGPFNEEFGWRG